MSIQITDYPDPQGASGDVIPAAYMYIVQTNICYVGGTSGQVTAYIYRSAAAAADGGVPNVDQILVALGEVLVQADGEAPAVTFPTLVELATNAATLQVATPSLDPFNAFRAAVYEGLKLHPKLSGLTLTDVE
jgi:hypothetical protein